MSEVNNTTLAPFIPLVNASGTEAVVKLEGGRPLGKAGTVDAGAKDKDKLTKACQDFEAIFLRFILQKMRDTVPKDGLIETSNAQQSYQQMMDGVMADNISKSGTVGLAQILYKQMSAQEQSAAGVQAAAQGLDTQEKALQAVKAYGNNGNAHNAPTNPATGGANGQSAGSNQ